jgi:hypothetical protein
MLDQNREEMSQELRRRDDDESLLEALTLLDLEAGIPEFRSIKLGSLRALLVQPSLLKVLTFVKQFCQRPCFGLGSSFSLRQGTQFFVISWEPSRKISTMRYILGDRSI